MVTLTYIEFFIAILIPIILLILIHFDIKWYRKYKRHGIGYVLRNPHDEKKVKELNLAFCIREHHPVKIVTGDADVRIFDSEFCKAASEVKALYKNKNGDFPVEIVCGPVLIKNKEGISYVLEAAKKGLIRVYSSNMRQKQHFRVGYNSVYVEQPHGVLTENMERDISIYFNNEIERNYYLKKFEYIKSKSGVKLIDIKEGDIYNKFIVLTKEEFKGKSKFLRGEGKDPANMTYDELKGELKV